MSGIFWGLKTLAAFDVWTFEHILSGLSVGSIVKSKNKKHIKALNNKVRSNHKSVLFFEIIGVLFVAYLWETLEHYLEQGLAGATVQYWFQGTELWVNRLITDPLMLVLGYYLAKRFPKYVWTARILSVVWLVVHIFIFPHSMYLHYLF